jgi:hypothetical protein
MALEWGNKKRTKGRVKERAKRNWVFRNAFLREREAG